MDPELWRSLGLGSAVSEGERQLARRQRLKRAGHSGPSAEAAQRNRAARKAKKSAKKKARY